MISTAETLLEWAAGIFPIINLGASFSSFGTVLEYASDLNYFLPISEIFAITLAVFYALPLLLGATLVMWLIALIRGGSSRG